MANLLNLTDLTPVMKNAVQNNNLQLTPGNSNLQGIKENSST